MSQILRTIRSEITQAALRLGLKQEAVAEISKSVEERVRRDYGGAEIYIPARDRCHRNAAIRREWNGANRDELCRRYKISRPTLYRILRVESSP